MNRKLALLATTIGVLTLASVLLVATSRAAPPFDQDDPVRSDARANETQPATDIEDLDQETVLYTVHSGTYESAIDSALRLQEIRQEQGFETSADFGFFVYLNDPEVGREDDRLIEIRLPVGPGALDSREAVKESAAAKGLGTTDVKEVGPTRVATISKRSGVSDPTELWNSVYAHASSIGLDPGAEGPMERFSGISAIPATCAYAELETELMVGIQ